MMSPKSLAAFKAAEDAQNAEIRARRERAEAETAEIERLRKVEEIAKAFLSEWDNPTPDYALRVNLKQRLRALVASTMPVIAHPIERAPRDGTRILAFDKKAGWRQMWWKVDTYEGAYWQDEFDSEPEPTHWIEMPVTMEEIRGY